MRNKSKLAKIKKNKMPQYPKDWLYMCPKELGIPEIKRALEKDYSVEYWEVAEVLEVVLKTEEEASVDFETGDLRRADEVTDAFIRQHGIKTVFLVTIRPESYEAAKVVMEKVIAAEGGFFCGDTADFSPMVR